MYLRDSINIDNVKKKKNSGKTHQEWNCMALSTDFKNELQCFVFFYDKHLSVDSTENIMSIECPHFIFPVLKHSGLSVNRDKM